MKKLYINNATATPAHSQFYSSFMRLPALRVLLILLIMVGVGNVGWGQTSTQNFGTTPAAITTATSSTSLFPNPTVGTTYARVGSGGGSINVLTTSNPLGTTGAYIRAVAATNTSVNKLTPIAGYTTGLEFYTSFKVLFGDASAGNTATTGSWTFYQGVGAMYSDVNDFTGAQVFAGLRFTYTTGGVVTLQNRNAGAWSTTGLTTTSFNQATVYTIEIVGNNKSSGTINYNYGGNAQTVAVQKFDLYINGILVGNDLAEGQLPANTNIASNTFIGISSASNVANVFVDDVVAYNSIPSNIGPTAIINITSSMSDFGNQTVNTISPEQQYTVSGTNLTSDIVITPPSGFEISTGTGVNFVSANPITLTQSGGSVNTTNIYVRFAPTLAQAYSASITHTTTNGNNPNLLVTGTGAGPAAPQAVAADPVGSTDFTAKWNASVGATSYKLDVATNSSFSTSGTPASDDFESGNLTNWSNTTNWVASNSTPITGTYSLRINASVAGSSYIYKQPTAYVITEGTTTWHFNIKTNFAPSGGNKAWFFLTSNSSNLLGSGNGYVVGFNYSGSDDYLKIWKVTNGVVDGAAIVASSYNVTSGTIIGVEVIRTANGGWTLNYKAGGGFTGMTTAGTGSDNTYTFSTYCGLVFVYTVSNISNLRFDDFSINGSSSSTLPGYSDLNCSGISQSVTGLTPNTNYYYRVRAVGGSATSTNSNTIIVTTAPTNTFTVGGGGAYCSGGTGVNITLSGSETGVNYVLWKDGSATVTNSDGTGFSLTFANVTASGNYTIVGTNTGGTSSTMSGNVNVTIEATPVAGTIIKTPNTTSVCEGATLSAALTPGSGGSGSDELEFSFDGGTYTAYTTGTNLSTIGHTSVDIRTRRLGTLCGASAYTTVSWTVNALPTVIIANNSPICSGNDVTFTLTGTSGAVVTYSFDEGTTTSTTTLTSGTATINVTGATANQTLTLVSVTDGTCSNTLGTTSTVIVNPLPIATATSNSPVSEGGTLNLTGGPGGMTTYAWTGSNNFGTQSPSKSSVILADAGTYTLTVTDANSCTAQASTIVTVLPQINWANLQWPGSGTITLGDAFVVYAQVLEPGITAAAGQGAGITCSIGYSNSNTDPSTWTNWVDATYNGDNGNNDEYKADLGAALLAPGTIYYASRFQLGTAAYVYGGYKLNAGGFWDGTINVSGVLTVNNPPQITFANVQYPASGSIPVNGTFNVYAQVFKSGVTEAAGQGAGITAWIGYSTSNTNPDTWTNWVPASFNVQAGSNDEYIKDIAIGLPAGTYYYASRFKYNLADYVYGGYNSVNGGFWNGTTNVSGVLTVVGAPAAFNVTGTGSYCTGGLDVGLDGSEIGVTYTITPGSITVEGTGAPMPNAWPGQIAGTYTVSGSNIGGSTGMTGNAVITINGAPVANAGPALDVASLIDAYTFPTAVATGGSILWTIESSSPPGIGSIATGTETTEHPSFNATSTGVVTLRVTVTGCNTNVSDDITLYILGSEPIIWSGASANSSHWNDQDNWVPAIVPKPTTDARIRGGAPQYPTLTAPSTCMNLTIEYGGSIIDNGFLTLANGGQLTVEHLPITPGIWHLISSPVSGAVSGLFTGQYLRDFVTSSNSYLPIIPTTTLLTAMKGYALWPKSPSSFTAPYVGGLNKAASYSFAVSTSNIAWNLAGNPYPSAIDWDASSGWTKTNVNNSIYIMDGTATGWMSYVGSVGATPGVGTNGGSRYIAPTQGFFVKASGNGDLVMDNLVRVHNTRAFYKSSNGVVPNLVRLEVSGNGFKDEAVVRFTPEATAEFDGNYDALKLYGDVTEAAQLYSLGSVPLSINSLPETDMVPVGIKVGISGSYTIAATEINNLGYATLEDVETGILTPLSSGSYTFTAEPGTFDQRFKLHFSLTSVQEAQKVLAVVYSYQRTVHINMKDQQKGDIFIYNITGQLIKTIPSATGMNEVMLPVTGNYVIKVISKDKTTVRKVWIQ